MSRLRCAERDARTKAYPDPTRTPSAVPAFQPLRTRSNERLDLLEYSLWELTRTAWVGVEYYAETGSIRHFEALSEQRHLVLPAIDLRTASGWDISLGVGRGRTGGSEHWVVKSIVGVRFRGRGQQASRGRSPVTDRRLPG